MRKLARKRLDRSERHDPRRLQAEIVALGAERAERHRSLADICGVPFDDWQARCRRIQNRIDRVAQHVNARRSARELEPFALADTPRETNPSISWFRELRRAMAQALTVPGEPTEPIEIAEQLEYHVVVDGLSQDVASQIESYLEGHAAGVVLDARIVSHWQRSYPQGSLAAHAVGYLVPVDSTAERNEARDGGIVRAAHECNVVQPLVGTAGVEMHCERVLCGRSGLEQRIVDRRGRIVTSDVLQKPTSGKDITLTLDVHLQHKAEALLKLALELRNGHYDSPRIEYSGGALVVLECHTGAMLAVASAPSFDPNRFSDSQAMALQQLRKDPSAALMNRATRMALPAPSFLESGVRPHVADPARATLTPLRVAQLVAAVANGGRLVVSYVVEQREERMAWGGETEDLLEAIGMRHATLDDDSLAALRRIMKPDSSNAGDAVHQYLDSCSVRVDAAMDSVETQGDLPAHAWLAGYAPADEPQVAFAIALEYAGHGASAAGPVARDLVNEMDRLGYFSSPRPISHATSRASPSNCDRLTATQRRLPAHRVNSSRRSKPAISDGERVRGVAGPG
jgi:cell division protein FtsI/penicillin-binding protein 2